MAEQLTKQQEMAVFNRGGKLLVSAAAGSGKTKVLVDRLISYLNNPISPANLDDFLIITYTKAAASELRGKIAGKLAQLIAQDPGNRHLRRQMQRLYLTKISTVHSFCGDILREYAYSLDISPDFRVADETECVQLQQQVMDNILEDAYEMAVDDPDFCAFVDTQGLGRDDRLIPQIVLKVYQSARCHLDPEGWLQWCCQASDTSGLTDAGQTIWGKYLIEDLRNSLDLHIDALTACAKMASMAAEMEKPAALLHGTVEQLKNLRNADSWDEIISRKNIDYGRLTFSKKCVDLELVDRIKAVRNKCKNSIERKLVSFSDRSEVILHDLKLSSDAARGLIAITKRFSLEYEKCKRNRRILDFGDLEHRMLDLLIGRRRSGPTAVARELGARYREIMVDEYQDSNGVQDAIFEALTQVNCNCFMVGDVKQSIYQFRLADPDIFMKKYTDYVPAEIAQPGQGRKVLLSSNFRSSYGVISAVNDVFSNCMSASVGGLDYGPDEHLHEGIPHISIGEPEVELYGIPVREDTYTEEAAFVANRICQLLDGTHMVRSGDALRIITPDDIVILLRSPGSVGADFVHALEKRGIRCTTGGSVDLLQTEEISMLRSFLQIISNPLQDIPLLAVLLGRIVGFTADEIAAIRGGNRHCSIYDAISSCENVKMKGFLQLLTALRTDARLYNLPELLQKLFQKTRMDSIYAAMPDGESRLSNLQTFCQIAADFESGGQKDLSLFLDHLSAMEEKGLVYPGQLQQAGAVTVMSIHKSKGLEFPVVFLCGLSRRFNQESAHGQVLCHKDLGLGLNCMDSKNRIRYPTIAKRAISTRIMAEGVSEELRVLYVAMTRPKDRLIMTYAASDLEGDIRDMVLRMDLTNPQIMTSEIRCPGEWVLQTAVRRVESGALFAIGGRPDTVTAKEPAWMVSVTEAPIDENTLVAHDEAPVAVPVELAGKLKEALSFQYGFQDSTRTPSKQTATQLKGRFKDQEAAEYTKQIHPHSFRKAGFSAPISTAKDFGNAMHSVMQYINYDVCVDRPSVDIEVQRLVDSGYIPENYGKLVDTGMIASLFATEIGIMLRSSDHLLREFKFSILEKSAENESDEILLQGVVDCAILDDDGITVIDYKTDFLTDETVADRTAYYAPQVRVYARALSRIYKKPVKAAFVYYFSLNRFEQIQIM